MTLEQFRGLTLRMLLFAGAALLPVLLLMAWMGWMGSEEKIDRERTRAAHLAELLARELERPVLIGPDAESAQWIAQAACAYGFDHGVCHKDRHGDREVTIHLPDLDVRGRAVVVLDDVASSGRTLAGATRLLLAAGAASVDVAVTHALFAGDALDVIHSAGVRHVWSTDCITHASNAVSVAPALADALCTIFSSSQ